MTASALPLLVLLVLALPVRPACPDDTTGFICTTCIDGCDACSDDTTCDTCSAQYYLEGGVCSSCPEKCLLCGSPYACDKCTPGYEKELNADGFEYCVFYWWKWFLIVFGSLLGLLLIAGAIWWVRNKLKEEDAGDKEVDYEMKKKAEVTEDSLRQ